MWILVMVCSFWRSLWTGFANAPSGVVAGQRRRWRSTSRVAPLTPLFAAQASDIRTLSWDDLLPESEVAPPKTVDHAKMPAMDNFPVAVSVGVVDALDGVDGHLPGFGAPLDVEEGKVSSLLLAPHIGACIHQPPPSPNQIVHVTFRAPVAVEPICDPVWMTGKTSLAHYAGSLAQAGCSMAGQRVERYEY